LYLLDRRLVDLVGILADGLPRHDVHVPGEEHAAHAALRHRLDEGVLDLRERPAIRDGILVLHDLRGLGQEVGIVAVEGVLMEDDAALLLVDLRRSLVARGIGDVREPLNLQLPTLRSGQAELVVLRLVETVATDEHSDEAGVELLAQGVQHHADDLVAQAGSHLPVSDPVDRPGDLVVHRQRPVLPDVVDAVLVSGGDAVGRAVRHDHQGRDLNVVRLRPVTDELGSVGDRLHRGSATQRVRVSATVADIRLVVVGEQLLALGSIVLRRGEADEARTVVLEGGLVRADHFGVVPLRELVPKAHRVLDAPRLKVTDDLLIESVFRDVREAEHLERDLRLLAEPSQLEDLKEAVTQRMRHAARQVQQEHDAVVLAVLLDDL